METKIQELRKANKISQAELADEMGVTRQTIISLEKVAIMRRWNWLLKLLDILERLLKKSLFLRKIKEKRYV